jgi:glutathione S-transferase
MPENIKIDLWGSLNSRAFRVLWALEELEIPYNLHDLDFKKGDHKTEEFLKMNPFGKVPVLKFGETTLFESGAIIEFLASQFPEKKLAPALDGPLYAKYLQWNYFAMAELEQPLWSMAKHKFALPKEYRLEDIKKTATFEFQKALAVIEQTLINNSYLLGEHFYACDILVGHTLIWARSVQQLDESHPHSLEYLKRLKKRKAILNLKK